LSYGDKIFITHHIISACPRFLQPFISGISAKSSFRRHSCVSLSEQIVYCCHCFRSLFLVNLAIIPHCCLKVRMSSQYPDYFRISDIVRPVLDATLA